MSQLPLFLYAEDEAGIRALFAEQTDLHTGGARLQLLRSKRSLGLANSSETAFQFSLHLTPHSKSGELAQFLWGSLSRHGQRALMLEQTVVTDQAQLQSLLQQTMAKLWPHTGLQLLSLHLPAFGGLRDFTLHFTDYIQPQAYDANSPWVKNSLHAVLSLHTADQASLLQALLQIFQDAASGSAAKFAYRLRYRMHAHTICLHATPGAAPQCDIDDAPAALQDLRAPASALLPRRILLQGALHVADISPLQQAAMPVLQLDGQGRADFIQECARQNHPAWQAMMARMGLRPNQLSNISEEQARIAAMAGAILAADGAQEAQEAQEVQQAPAADLIILMQPESGLHPQWQARYALEMAAALEAVTAQAGAAGGWGGQIVLASQAPLLLADLRRAQIHLVQSQDGQSSVSIPEAEPQGMGVAGLLQSELFGLSSTLDRSTLAQLQQRNALLAEQANRELRAHEAAQLQTLRNTLAQMGFAQESADPLYRLFLQGMHAARQLPLSALLSAEEMAQQTRLAQDITRRLLAQEHSGALAQLAQELRALDGE
ncbi:hypothetical protein V8J88_07770 [Massilia sp. W12]|uniref:hypothetical protein n=1 Tax=Massilia sp. W12 TaxID=3126507 RepID=UPI0030CBE5F3